MQPLAQCPPEILARLTCILCDLDDTLTLDGRLPARAYGALERIHDSGLAVVLVTGRPAGWCDHFARMWPLDGVIGENGAFWFRYDHAERRMERTYWRTADERAADRRALDALAHEITAAVAGASVSADQAYREADLAIDFCEDVAPLAPGDIETIVRLFEAAGARARVSSIHVNGWFGDYDKCAMTERFLNRTLGLDMATARKSVLFIGDSPNDEPMFEAFPNSAGVANIARFAKALAHPPRWITRAEGGHGFAEFADRLLAVRR